MRRTASERKADDRDSVRSNIEGMGAHGALLYAYRRLPEMPPQHVRRMLVLTVREAARRLELDVRRARRLAACHAVGLRTLGVKLALLLALAAPAAAQGTTRVYTNVVDGRPLRDTIVVVERPARPAAPVPASITTTPVLPRNWRPPAGPTSYVPPAPAPAAALPRWAERPLQPRFINGVYVGPARSWTSTVIGMPVVDVRIVDTPRRRPR